MDADEMLKSAIKKHEKKTVSRIFKAALTITKEEENEETRDALGTFFKLFKKALEKENLFTEEEFQKEAERIIGEWMHTEYLKNKK